MAQTFYGVKWTDKHQKQLEENYDLPIKDLMKLLQFSGASINKRKRDIKEKREAEEMEFKRQKSLWGYSNENILTISEKADKIIAEYEKNKR
jgi:hypothetical protein